jgi:hypothetical protein
MKTEKCKYEEEKKNKEDKTSRIKYRNRRMDRIH